MTILDLESAVGGNLVERIHIGIVADCNGDDMKVLLGGAFLHQLDDGADISVAVSEKNDDRTFVRDTMTLIVLLSLFHFLDGLTNGFGQVGATISRESRHRKVLHQCGLLFNTDIVVERLNADFKLLGEQLVGKDVIVKLLDQWMKKRNREQSR